MKENPPCPQLVRSLVLAVLLPCQPPGRKSPAGTIVGLVEDPSGAVIPNAEIAIKQADHRRGRARPTPTPTANSTFLFCSPATTVVTASAGGFKSKTLSGITLRVDQTVNLRITLERWRVDRNGRSHRGGATGRFGDFFAGPGDREQADSRSAAKWPQPVCARPSFRQHDAHVRHGFESAVHRGRRPIFGQ